MSQDDKALEYAAAERRKRSPTRLKSDRDIVLAALGQDVRALEHAAAELKSERQRY